MSPAEIAFSLFAVVVLACAIAAVLWMGQAMQEDEDGE